ncbi:uncharacterized, partial [Tachysurus ichikawai]
GRAVQLGYSVPWIIPPCSLLMSPTFNGKNESPGEIAFGGLTRRRRLAADGLAFL